MPHPDRGGALLSGGSIIGIDERGQRVLQELRGKGDMCEEDKFPVVRMEKGRPIEETAGSLFFGAGRTV